MRNILDILDEVTEIAPGLTPHFEHIRRSAPYVAPEAIPDLWALASKVLNTWASDHPRREEIMRIWAGEEQTAKNAAPIGDLDQDFLSPSAQDFAAGADHIPGKVTLARQLGETVIYDRASRTWTFQNGSITS